MKKLLLIILLISLLGGIKAQNTWIDQGAEWYYNYTNIGEQGYVHFQYVSDTTINGKTCQKITGRKDTYATTCPTCPISFIGSSNYASRYTYSSNDSVFYYNNGGFNLLYDFGAQIGESWTIDVNSDTLSCSKDSAKVTVDSIGNILINGTSYRFLKLTTIDSSTHDFSGIHIERFGNFSNTGYLFPKLIRAGLTCDNNTVIEWDFYSFNCFNDQSFSFASDSSLACSQPSVSIFDNYHNKIDFSIFPNPVNQGRGITIDVQHQAIQSINIINTLGEIVLEQNFNKKLKVKLTKGVYFVQLFNQNQLVGSKQLVITE